jgi:hypothetical protein
VRLISEQGRLCSQLYRAVQPAGDAIQYSKVRLNSEQERLHSEQER